KGFPWREDSRIAAAQSEVERVLDGKGRVLLRASGTEPLLRVMVEGEDALQVREQAEKLAEAVRKIVA
ncbi:MAG: hypothetical protein RIR18_2136, partial [Pseudomonadota bacterium]